MPNVGIGRDIWPRVRATFLGLKLFIQGKYSARERAMESERGGIVEGNSRTHQFLEAITQSAFPFFPSLLPTVLVAGEKCGIKISDVGYGWHRA